MPQTMSFRWRRTRLLRLTTCLAVAMSFIPGAAEAFPTPSDPLLAERVHSGNGWSSYRIAVGQGSTFDLQVLGWPSKYSMNGYGIWLMRADGSLRAAFLLTGYATTINETYVSVAPPVGVDHYDRSGGNDSYGPPNGGTGIGWHWTDLPAGEYSVIIGGASDRPIWPLRAAIYGDAGVSVLSEAHGDGAFMNYEPDFEATANVMVSRYATGQAAVRAGAMVGGSASETVTKRLFGLFQATTHAIINVDTPSGSTESPGIQQYLLFSGREPGDYRFNVKASAGAAPPFSAAVWAWGLDAPIL